MNGHLVSIKVGVESRTHQRVKLDGFAFNQTGVKGLDREFVERRRPVEHDWIAVNHFFEALPHFVGFLLDHFFGLLEGRGVAFLLQLGHQVRLEEFKRHFFRQSTLVHPQIRADDDDRTA